MIHDGSAEKGCSVADLDTEIHAFEQMLSKLEAEYMDRWVLIHDGQFINGFDTFDLAISEAVKKFGRGPYLIRQIGAQPDPLPVSVVFAWPNAES